MLTYTQRTGDFTLDGEHIGRGYSGRGQWLNNPAGEHIRGEGPIPKGAYIMSAPRTSKNTGPYTIDLTPDGHNALGRTLLRIHGDNILLNNTASHGCIIAPRMLRKEIWESVPDHKIKVI